MKTYLEDSRRGRNILNYRTKLCFFVILLYKTNNFQKLITLSSWLSRTPFSSVNNY